MCVSLCVSLYVCLCVSLCVCVCLSLSLHYIYIKNFAKAKTVLYSPYRTAKRATVLYSVVIEPEVGF